MDEFLKLTVKRVVLSLSCTLLRFLTRERRPTGRLHRDRKAVREELTKNAKSRFAFFPITSCASPKSRVALGTRQVLNCDAVYYGKGYHSKQSILIVCLLVGCFFFSLIQILIYIIKYFMRTEKQILPL